nr:type II secretion system protein [uncultured Oscillibacter sp.]
MENLKAKLKKQGGFTMVELLIVVAIIAILVAVSIPMMNSALEKSREAVDQANYRDAIALASVKYMTDPDAAKANEWLYCVDGKHQGSLRETAEDGYTAVTPACTCTPAMKDVDLKIKIEDPDPDDETPKITLSWAIQDGKTIEGEIKKS